MIIPTAIILGVLLSIYFTFSTVNTIIRWKTKSDMAQRYNGPVNQGSVTIPLTFENGIYYGKIVVGTPKEGEDPQVLKCVFDTGVPNLWIAEVKGCEPDCNQLKIKPYDATKSTTNKNMNRQMGQSMLDTGMVIGHISRDKVQIQGNDDKSIVVDDQLFGEADEYFDNFDYNEAIFGLSLLSHSFYPKKPEPPVWSLAKRFAKPVFGFYFSTYPGKGRLMFGGGDEDAYEGEFTSHPVVTGGRDNIGWVLKIDAITVMKGDSELGSIYPESNQLLAHMVTNLEYIVGPQASIDRINKAIFKSAGVEYDSNSPNTQVLCSKGSELPIVTFIIGGKMYTLTNKEYVYNVDGKCISAFQAARTSHFHLGRAFMIKYYTRFDVGNKQVQFAKLKSISKKVRITK